MWSSTGKSLLRCRLAQMQRASFFLAYCFYWDAKKSVLSPLKSDSYQSLNFHGFYVVTTFFVMPVLTMRSVVLLLSVSEDEDKLMVSMTFLGTALIWVIIPHLRMFGRPPEREGFVSCVNTMFVLEEKLKEIIPDLSIHLSGKVASLIRQISRSLNVLYFTMDNIITFGVPFLALSKSSPTYALLLSGYDFESLGCLVSTLTLISTGAMTFFYTRMVLAVISFVINFVTHGVALVAVWTLVLVDSRVEFGFIKSVKIYRCLTIIKNFHVDTCHHLGSVCAHHAFSVVAATTGLYFLLTEYQEIDPLLLGGCGSLVVVSVALEMATITYLAMVGRNSARFLELMRNMNRGDKLRRRIMASLGSNAINLEVISSVETMRNGVGLEYFMNFVTRVTSYTIDLILTKN
ncbi:hypothetical protein Fcan01_17456 [Folsomia candida]|uniref:Odorant receptor n=1 Tax=Folsomia candida TaxID=158441 RepID=A0A226DTH9_FOLCA|nr:hypothetical protein Fcan01_17456 [Folsomia candida]